MRRRELITLLGGAAAWPLLARAQQPTGKLLTIGMMGTGTPSTQGQWHAAFMQRMGQLGWTEGRNITTEVRWAEGRTERFAQIAAEFVRLKVDVIVAAGAPAIIAAKQATATIPIVSSIMAEPVRAGLVVSLARPGGNVTGISIDVPGLGTKRIELLRELVPDVHRLAIVTGAGNPYAAVATEEIKASAPKLGLIDVFISELRRAEDVAPAIEALKGKVDAIYVVADPFMTTHRMRINTMALSAKLPTMHFQRDYVEAAGLMSYGPNVLDLFRRAAEYVDKILRGTKPADLPVEQPTKFNLVINLTTARALGLKVPESFLVRADELIE
jgi:putative ABC transport system substrate-binding protein